MIVGEYGVVFLFNTSYDMSANTQLTIIFTKPDGSTLTVNKTNGVALGVSPIVTNIGIFQANQYATYEFQNGDVNQAGDWEAVLQYDGAGGKHLIAPCAQFVVHPVCGT